MSSSIVMKLSQVICAILHNMCDMKTFKTNTKFCTFPLTSSHRRPFKPAIHFQPPIGGRLNTHSVFCLEPCQHATRGRDIVQDGVYTRKCFSESERTRFGGPAQKALKSMNEFTLLLIFLIPLYTTCSFDGPAKIL